MDELDKIEKLKKRANVTYEEARKALSICDGDLLDAMVYLERQGRAKAPEQTTFSTDASDKASYENVSEVVERHQETDDPSFGEQLGRALKIGARKSMDNYLVISHKHKEVFRLPLLLFIVILLFGHLPVLLSMIISLFCDVRYSFEGKDDLSKINEMMDKAGDKADQWIHESREEDRRNAENIAAAEQRAKEGAEKYEKNANKREETIAEKYKRKADERAAKFERKADEIADKFEKKGKEIADKYEKKYGSRDEKDAEDKE